MTYPGQPGEGFTFQQGNTPQSGESVVLGEQASPPAAKEDASGRLPPPILTGISDEARDKFIIWLDQWLQDLDSAQSDKQTQWATYEEAYRALPPGALEFEPFAGSCKEVIPVGAMAVDPIHARLDTGIFKQDPVISIKPLKKSVKDIANGLQKFINFYQKHYLNLRAISSPRILECAKLGSMVFKTVYDKDVRTALEYDENFQVQKVSRVVFAGPRVIGISLGDLLFPPNYQHLQDCPILFERQRTTYEKLLVLQSQSKLANVDKVKGQQTVGERTKLEDARETATKFSLRSTFQNELTVYEAWCDYDIDGDGIPEHLVATFHKDTRILLQLRLNYYFHQRKPYTLIPYTVANDTLYGLGIMEMVLPLQEAITRWHRMASDNAYLANIRMFIAKKNSGIEKVPRLYTGRTFFVDEPSKDFIPFAVSDTYPSTLAERQNLFGMVEKRTGVSDYLTGRESPIVGTRATATSTLALIQEGTRRVEEVLENLRAGFAELIENCVSIWIQFGTDGIEDLIFGDDDVAVQVKQFFANATQQNVNGAFAFELAATDATTARQAQQQMQLALIQVMMQYLEKVLEAGNAAIQAIQAGVPQYADMVKVVMDAARTMFLDLVKKYDVPDAESYLPDLRVFIDDAERQQQEQLAAASGQGVSPDSSGQPEGSSGGGSLPVPNGPARGPAVPSPATPGSGGSNRIAEAVSRAGGGA